MVSTTNQEFPCKFLNLSLQFVQGGYLVHTTLKPVSSTYEEIPFC
ncbi:hypothetical protein NSTCB13_04093 [Nostoc sp. DSM 114160]|jgi:hypothetical protein